MKIENAILVKEKMERIAVLLGLGGYADWSINIRNLAQKYENNPGVVKNTLLGLYGGMGSLNDLLLYSNGKLLIDENEKSDQLRSELLNLFS